MVSASAKYVRISARKARVVADQIRGKSYEEAEALLSFSPRGASVPMLKLLRSAGANAENNDDLDPEDMRVARVSVDEGPTMRRFRPRAKGRATRIDKRSCHINISLTPIPDED
ncbi:MAG: 50S ribosomal protein L22 [Solirubrobacterales bacterium]|nr:50S ribosomal protein L22 [Thermoleophilales bacterium]MCO5328157.1 50S ribosomal protein L22 [Solirubrobacterales bacterium]